MLLKKILALVPVTLLMINLTAQQKMNNYEKAWSKIDSLIQKNGLTQSALTEVNKIYTLAKKEKNEPQLIKALLYRMSLEVTRDDNAQKKGLQSLEQEAAGSTGAAKAILQSIVAEGYYAFFQQVRWKIYNRTNTVDLKKDDPDTWSADDFHKKISGSYLASLSNEKLLQQTKLEPFDPIIIKGNMRNLRPTLFDLLAHRALDYFGNDERDITRPAYAFEIDDPAALADAASFMHHEFRTKDESSLHFKALQLYQRILQFHAGDAQPDATIDADIDRIRFAEQYGIMPDKDQLYLKALEQITGRYGQLPVASQAWYLQANWFAGKAGSYDPVKDTAHRYAYKDALAICEKVTARQEPGEGKSNCQQLQQQILTRSISLQTEKVNIPGQPFRTLVEYRNFTQLWFRIVNINKNTRESLGRNEYEDDYWKKLVHLPALRSFSQSFPDTKDYQLHRAEIKVDALPTGQYAIIASTNPDFTFTKEPMAVQYFYVSNIAYINKNSDYYVLNRETGAPLVRASVQVWYRYYDYNSSKYTERKGENIMTDANGFFHIEPSKTRQDNNLRIEITTKEDHLFLDDYTYNYSYPSYNTPQQNISSFLFTDRAIYRPGQLLYVKGIVVQRDHVTNQHHTLPNLKSTLVLYDVNGQKVDSIQVTTSEFGSYSAKFNLPSGLLNGNFRIEDAITKSSKYFRVEEYKRPKFSTGIDKPAGTYRLNDEIKVTGHAKAYAGNVIDGATVKYRVTRQTIMPYWFFAFDYGKMIWPPQRGENMEIAHGETTTDANGNFNISFKAIPDNSIDKKNQPVFHYEVSADVTDINGETRSGNTSVAVAYQALQLNINVPDRLHTDSLKQFRISTTNLNNLFEQSTVTLTIQSLQAPNRLFRSRYWSQPDQFVMSADEYYRSFPNDLYSDEGQVSQWPRGQKLFEKTDTTTADSKFDLGNLLLPAGWYVLEAVTKDKYGETVKDMRYVQLFNKTKVNPSAYVSIDADKKTLEPGEALHYQVNTNLSNVFVIQEVIRKNNEEKRSVFNIDQNSRDFTIPVSETDRGGLQLEVAFVKNNRVYLASENIGIPYTNKELTIAYETFRDKTLPGSQEKWKLKISGYKNEKVAAELLTAMYDASLDQFSPQSWSIPSLQQYAYRRNGWQSANNFQSVSSREKQSAWKEITPFNKTYDVLNTYGFAPLHHYNFAAKSDVRLFAAAPATLAEAEMAPTGARRRKGEEARAVDKSADMSDSTATSSAGATENTPGNEQANATPRKNFNETAFFFPDLRTDANGNIEFSFTMPEALTQWKWMSLAHTQDLSFGYSEKNIITQKELMVQPNAPRFLREGDRMDFSGKIVNLSDKELSGQVSLQLIDPSTNQSVDGWFQNMTPNQFFTVAAGQSTPVSFTVQVPYQYNRPVSYRIMANAASLSDGEEAMLPVVSNRMLVTESLPLPVRGNTTKNFTFKKLLESSNSETLNNHDLTVEFTTNPAWYAVQALPYLMEYPYECAEQVFNRYYANALATSIVNVSPRVKAIFESWKTTDTAALLSNLQKNEELKSVLLQETPWVMQARTEAQQKKQIALLFDMVRMSTELQSSLAKLQDLQSPNGGFVWFKGGPDDRYITQYIIASIGHLKKLNALPKNDQRINAIISAAIPYLDKKLQEDYDNLIKHKTKLTDNNLGYSQIQFLYMRSFFPEYAVPGNIFTAYNYYRKQSQQFWLQQSRYMQGMIALSLHRTGDLQTAKEIVASLKQNAIVNEEMGMYWKDMSAGYYWHQAPIESHALLIETFAEVTKDNKAVEDLKTWLLKQKQTQNWRTTKATADACYALLLQGKDWLSNEPTVTIKLGNLTVNSADQHQEAGTGYFKKVIEAKSVKPAMGNIQVTVSSNSTAASPAWGAVYWQYFENLDKITHAATPLNLSKKLFVEKNTDRGPVLQPVNEGDALKIGDKIKVRIELRVDRDMEYVHMKDMRAACLEPVNVISQYKWQGGLGYYESTKDASTNFFFGYLRKGTWVFEYPLFVTHSGTFSNGVTTIQCMYAPEFTSHSEGVKVNVEK